MTPKQWSLDLWLINHFAPRLIGSTGNVNWSCSSILRTPVVWMNHLVIVHLTLFRVSTISSTTIHLHFQLWSTVQHLQQFSHACIWVDFLDQLCQMSMVCVHRWTGLFANTANDSPAMHTDPHPLLLFAKSSRLRIWFHHGQRNHVCILFLQFGLLFLLLLLTHKNMTFYCSHLQVLLSPFQFDHANIHIILDFLQWMFMFLEQLCLLPKQSLPFLLKLQSLVQQFLPFHFRLANIVTVAIIIGVIGSIVIVHPACSHCRDFRNQSPIQCRSSGSHFVLAAECNMRSSQLTNVTFLSPHMKHVAINGIANVLNNAVVRVVIGTCLRDHT